MGLMPGLLSGLLVILLQAGPPASSAAPKVEDVTLRGKVVPLGAALKSLGVDAAIDPGSASGEVVMLGEDRSITPLLRDDASRALFLDARLRDCRAEIRGRRFAGVPYLQVTTFRVERDGQLRTPEYFCDVCSITLRFPQDCPCCQGPVELRMKSDQR